MLGNSVEVLWENFLQGKVFYIVETKEQVSGSWLMLLVFRQLFSGDGSIQIGNLLALSKASSIDVKEKNYPLL